LVLGSESETVRRRELVRGRGRGRGSGSGSGRGRGRVGVGGRVRSSVGVRVWV
jgi:hypothetical protein